VFVLFSPSWAQEGPHQSGRCSCSHCWGSRAAVGTLPNLEVVNSLQFSSSSKVQDVPWQNPRLFWGWEYGNFGSVQLVCLLKAKGLQWEKKTSDFWLHKDNRIRLTSAFTRGPRAALHSGKAVHVHPLINRWSPSSVPTICRFHLLAALSLASPGYAQRPLFPVKIPGCAGWWCVNSVATGQAVYLKHVPPTYEWKSYLENAPLRFMVRILGY